MNKCKFVIPVLAGLFAGNVFAESDRPFTVVNTLRVGYDDNVYRSSANPEESAFIEDIVDLSFRAALSDRTDLVLTSRFNYRADKESKFYPSLYAVLTHAASPRFMFQLSDKLMSGNKSNATQDKRYDYFENLLSFEPAYVLTRKDSLSAPVSYKIRRHDDVVDHLDTDVISAGLTWKRELSPQQTWAALHVKQTMTDYINSDYDITTDSTLLAAELSHTFNPKWRGNVMVGATLDQTEYTFGGTNNTSDAVNPYFSAGLGYEPTPKTRFSANVSQQFAEANDFGSGGQTARALALSAEHDFTARITGRATARFSESEYDQDNGIPGTGDSSNEGMDLALRLQYTINRINFLEMGLSHREKSYDKANRDWDQNMFDVGWRVEL